MTSRWLMLTPALLLLAPTAWAQQDKPEAKKPAKTYQVPFELTDTQHVLVRVKLNGKGPFNFIIDTGAPMLFVSVPVAKKIGLEADKKGWATLSRFELDSTAGFSSSMFS